MIDSFINIENLSLEFEILDSSKQSLKKEIIDKTVGGFLNKNKKNKTIIRSLSNINLKIKSGDKIGLIGHNGSGKSSLLQVIAGIYEQTSGEINVKGSIIPIIDLNHGLDFEATGYENIIIKGILYGNEINDVKKNLDAIIEFSELGDFINMPIKNYSMGMILRLAFATATFQNAQIFLLDEWLSVGDESFIKKCEARLNDMIQNSEILIFASHDMSLINRVCNKIVRLESGKIIEEKLI